MKAYIPITNNPFELVVIHMHLKSGPHNLQVFIHYNNFNKKCYMNFYVEMLSNVISQT